MPEEINRIVADHTSDILLCPTQTAVDNARKEGLDDKAFLVGDIMVDTVEYGLKKAKEKSTILHDLGLYRKTGDIEEPEPYYLLTLHRPYNVDDPNNLKHILDGLNSLEKKVLFPVHPRTRKVINQELRQDWSSISLIEPQAYLDFMMLHSHALAMITDSGGVQKEAYLLKKPCITLRTETEWVETVDVGWNLLLPPQSPDFPAKIGDFTPPNEHPDLYGIEVGKRMAEILLSR